MKIVKINFMGIYNLDNKNSYRQFLSENINYIFASNRVGKTILSKIPAFTLGADVKLEKLHEEYSNFMTILSLKINNNFFYVIRLISQKFTHNLYILNSNFDCIFQGKWASKKEKNTFDFNKELYNLFDIENIICKKTPDRTPIIKTPYIGTFLEFFNIFQENWGEDFKNFSRDNIKIKKNDFLYTFLYLTEEITDQQAGKMLNRVNLDNEITKLKEKDKNIDFLLKALSELTVSKLDIENLKDLSNKNENIMKKINEIELKLIEKINDIKEIKDKILKYKLIFNDLENNIQNIIQLDNEYNDFYQEVTIKDDYKKKIFYKDLVGFKIKYNQNLVKKEEIENKLNLYKKQLKIKQIDLKKMQEEKNNLYNNLINFEDQIFNINNKNLNENIKQIIDKYDKEKLKNLGNLKLKENEREVIIKANKKLDKSVKNIEIKYTDEMGKIIKELNLKFTLEYKNFIHNTKFTGAEAVIYSLVKLFINFLYVNKINFFFIIDSLKEKDQDRDTIRAREDLIKKIIFKNNILDRQIIIFSSDRETVNLDYENKKIKEWEINRKSKSLLEQPDDEFNLWLESNILPKLN